jgi:hypothetical protein
MPTLTRRGFLLSAAALTASCAGRGRVSSPPAEAAATVRRPEIGESWSYAKRALGSGAVDTEINRVSAVGRMIAVESHLESNQYAPNRYPSWGSAWLDKYMVRGAAAGPLPGEVQEPWGMILVDPHWGQIQAYEEPIPLWPAELRPDWSITVGTRYKTLESNDALPWQLTIHTHGWESVTVPAGQFKALRYTNIIDFRYTNVSGRDAAQRIEHLWFAPEIGRWVIRESSGSFYQDVGEEFRETAYRWELLRWT